jgi:hypothetical protein
MVWTMPRNIPGLSTEVESDVHWAYDQKLVNTKGGARGIYNVLRASAGSRCPICMSRTVGHLDHYLPREKFPGLAIQPSNLIPICSHCNDKKKSVVAVGPDDQFLHPYFDDLGDATWLIASLVEEPTAPVTFSVQRAVGWSDQLHARVLTHFDRFQLGDLYSSAVATHLGGQSSFLKKFVDLGQSGAVQQVLREMASSYRDYRAEPWLAAAMDSWAESDWFCEGGWLVGT